MREPCRLLRARSFAGHLIQTIEHVLHCCLDLIVRFATLPYYRNFYFNTLRAIEQIASSQSESAYSTQVLTVIARFRDRKTDELQFTSIACAVLSAAVIGCIQWQSTDTAYWLSLAFWYSSLVFAVLGILLAAQQITVLSHLGPLHRNQDSMQTRAIVERYLPLLVVENGGTTKSVRPRPMSISKDFSCASWRPQWRMVFIWQCPIMFTSYSVCTFFLGLTLQVITPLIRLGEQPWDSNATVAVFYLVLVAIATVVFCYCSFWIYRDVGYEIGLTVDDDREKSLKDLADIARILRLHEHDLRIVTERER